MSRAMGRNREDIEAGCADLLPEKRALPCIVSSTAMALVFFILYSVLPGWLFVCVLLMTAFIVRYANCQQRRTEDEAEARAIELVGDMEGRLRARRTREELPVLKLQLALTERDFDDLDYEDLRALDDDITFDASSTSEGVGYARFMVQSHEHTQRMQEKEVTCIICLERFLAGELIRTLPCLHQVYLCQTFANDQRPWRSSHEEHITNDTLHEVVQRGALPTMEHGLGYLVCHAFFLVHG